jgi:V/A-type H+-transporting ATPase subunit K
MKNKNMAPLIAAVMLTAVCGQAAAAEPGAAEIGSRAVGLGLAAAVTMSICVLGSGYAVGRIGSAAMGAAAEKPELLMRSLLFVALAEGLAVLGFVISMMLLQKI